MIEFRDRLGWSPEPTNAKIIPLPIFNLLVQKPSVTLTHNPLVGGSSPPGPTIPLKIKQLDKDWFDIYLVLLNYFLV